MATKPRYSNPIVGDDIVLNLFSYNSNSRADLDSIDKIEIYFLDPAEKTEENPDGRRLVSTIETADVELEETGLYAATLATSSPRYTIGKYIDIWYVTIGEESATIENNFEIFPNLWFTTPIPIIYDFNFAFRPNRLRSGEKRWLMVEITPNVPSQSDLISYYQNLAVVSPLKISIEQMCGECMPIDCDLRLIVDEADVTLREKCLAYYFLDTTDMEKGMYDVWFQIDLGESVYISERQQLQIV